MTGEEVRIETGVPGAVMGVIDLDGDFYAEVNGAGSVVAHVYPRGLDSDPESPAELVDRLTQELKDAKKALKKASA